MRQSRLFTKTRKESPADEVVKSAQLLLRAGYIHKEMAGVYSFLPLGVRVMERIVDIIDEQMIAIGGVEVSLSALQDPAVWKKTGRWDDRKIDVWFKTKLKNETEIGLGLTHEDPLTRLMKDHVKSFRDLPRFVYQFQTKFRNEVRAKSGLMRTREFLMKDLYSFTTTVEELDRYYEKVAAAYAKIFAAVGLGEMTHRTFASGGIFSKFSDEFQTICEAGEDTIFVANDKSLAINKEVFTDEVLTMFKKTKKDFTEHRSIEVGNIFKQGTQYSEALGLKYADEHGQSKPVVMGSYGIGPARVMATIVELFSDQAGIVWPKTIAPFDAHLIEIDGQKDPAVRKAANELCNGIHAAGFSLLHDERDVRAGEKFADSDLIGLPLRIVVSKKTLANKKYEVRDRRTGEVEMLSAASVVEALPS